MPPGRCSGDLDDRGPGLLPRRRGRLQDLAFAASTSPIESVNTRIRNALSPPWAPNSLSRKSNERR
ncbi:hypothetical protein T261_00379 [Streptomyces lydicus]|nr:hypothetical protein T261_00379 [Streptomyces lydicus]